MQNISLLTAELRGKKLNGFAGERRDDVMINADEIQEAVDA